jgi:hypothetical protein
MTKPESNSLDASVDESPTHPNPVLAASVDVIAPSKHGKGE